jgi:transcriptional regulator with XRE-family HTH domain
MNAMKITNQVKKKGRYVSALLIMHGINQAELAEKIGATQSFISQIINGRRIGAKEKGKLARQVIAESLGVAVEDLWPKKAA